MHPWLPQEVAFSMPQELSACLWHLVYIHIHRVGLALNFFCYNGVKIKTKIHFSPLSPTFVYK
jgi:hypothetical protein